jgi:hypothetical protein
MGSQVISETDETRLLNAGFTVLVAWHELQRDSYTETWGNGPFTLEFLNNVWWLRIKTASLDLYADQATLDDAMTLMARVIAREVEVLTTATQQINQFLAR